MEIYKWVPLDRKRHLRAPLSTAASGTTTPVHGSSATKLNSGSLTVDSSNVTSKAPSTGYETQSDQEIAIMLSQTMEIDFESNLIYIIFSIQYSRNVTPMNEDSNLSVASDSQDGTHPVVINTLNGSSNVTTASATEESSASNTATTNGTSKGT